MKSSRIAAFAVLSVATTACVAAQPDSFYVGLDGGVRKFGNGCGDFLQSLGYQASSFTCAKTARTIGGLVGYQFDSNFGAELSYTDFGKPNATAIVSGVPVSGYVYPTAFEFAFVGTAPIAKHFSFLGRLGVAITTTKIYVNAPSIGYSHNESAQSRTAVPGVGFQYDVGKVAARLVYDWYGNVGDQSTTGTTHLSALTLGLTYSF